MKAELAHAVSGKIFLSGPAKWVHTLQFSKIKFSNNLGETKLGEQLV